MKYEDWVKSRVYISDLRPFWEEFDGEPILAPGELYHPRPVPGYVFVQNGIKRLSENMGYFLVIDGEICMSAGNQEYTGKDPEDLEHATRWLWNEHGSHEYGEDADWYTLVYFERDENEIVFNARCRGRTPAQALQNGLKSLAKSRGWVRTGLHQYEILDVAEAIKELSRPATMYEFQGGHLVAVPLD